jgi:predicted DNA-binding antitoxin AbrB/MazE fold protein
MTQIVEAVYKNGSFRLVKPKDIILREGQNVRLTIETEENRDDVLALAAEVYEGLHEDEINDVEKIALDRKEFYGERK